MGIIENATALNLCSGGTVSIISGVLAGIPTDTKLP
jgi:hypothetical protein